MRNTGFATWDPARVRLISVNTPTGLWGVGNVTLPGPVAPGNAVEFVFTVQGPATPGTYGSQWRLQEFADGLGVFGETASGTVDVVTVSCGNGTVEGSERCDDGNNINGDGCAATCLIENLTFDQALTPADRTFVNDVGARDFGKVAIGDLNGDGVPDVAMGSWESVPANGNVPGRSLAGRVFVYSGVNLFDASTTTVGTGTPLLVVNGARANDLLSGQVEGRVLIQDVTGDGFADLIVSAAQAACIDNTNACGRVYVIAGGPQLAAVPNGVVDLLTSPFVTARIVGPFDGDRTSVITTGDLDNDGIRDVVVGMNRATVLGRVEAGAVSVVRGGPTLTGTIAASGAPEVVCEVAGAVAGDRLGLVAAVGQVNGAGGQDLVVGSSGHDSGTGGQDAGGVWVINGPLPAAVDLGATPAEWSARFLGAGIRDALGTDVRVADVTGDTNPDLIIGAAGTRIGATRFGSVDIWPGPIAAATDMDYSGGALPSVYFLGADEGDNVGACLAVGDMNGDRVSDVAVVGRFAGGAGNALFQAGEMYVLPGGAAGQIQVGAGARTLVPGNQAMTVFGSTAAGRMCLYNGYVALGDIDGDSRDDVCVGSPQANVTGNALVRPGRLDCYRSRW
jgi:cysteine-rich repeat protein